MTDAIRQMATVTSQAIRERGTDGYSRERPMSPAPTLTPQLALDYLRELSADIRTGAVFAARSPSHGLVVVCGRLALPSLIRYDLRLVLADLAGSPRPEAAA